MAQDAATLLVRIEATTMQLRKELAAADRAVSGSSSKIDKELGLVDKAFARMGLNAEQSRKAIGSAMAGITAAAAGGVAGLGALVVSTANSAREIQNLSQVANASTTEFQRYAVGAKTVGVEQEKLADILKDVNDRVGDFLTTGGGEMKDFFENIAPRIGVTAEQFRKLSGPQSLQLFYNSLEKANLSQAEMTFYMESMADETTALIPLLRDGGAGFSAMADEAERLGLVMSEKTLKQFDQFNAQMDTAKMAAGGFGTQIATEALPALSELNGLLIDFAQDSEAASVIGDALGVVLKGVATVAIGLSTTFANLGRAIGGLAAAASAAASMEFSQASSIIDQFTADNEAATAQAEQRIKKLWTGEYADAGKRAVEVNRTVSESSAQLGVAAKKSAEDQKKAIDEKLKSLDALIAKYDPAAKAQAAYDAGIKLADEALKNNTYTTEQYQKVVQGLYTDLNKPIWDKHNKQADEAAAAIKKIDDQLESVRDRLDPVRAATKRLTAEKKLLKEGLDAGSMSLEEYQLRLQQLDKEYDENTRATSEWAKWTEGALDRVDGAFADAWRNIGDGFSSFRDSLTDAFKQMLAELAHMAITKPIIMQIGASLGIGGGTQGNSGIWGSLLGGGSGTGGLDFGKLLNYGQTAYSMFTGVGPAALAGYQSGGIMGGLQGAAGYYGNLASSAWGTVSGWFGGSAAAGAGSAAGTGFGYGQSLVSGQIGNAAYAGAQAGAGSSLSGIAGNLGAIVGPIAGLYMAIKGYGAISNGYDFKPKDFDDEFSGVRLGAKVINAYENGITKVFGDSSFLSKALRIPVATIGGLMSSVFGGGWETKNYGMAFSVANGDFLGQSYEDQKKKGGLFGSDKKRTKYRSLDPETAAVLQETYDATQAGVADLFASLSLTVEEGSLDGLKLAREKISTKGKTEEEIQQAIAEWFGSAADAMTAELNKVFNTGLDLDLEGMQAFVGNLTGVNEVLRYLDVEMYDASVAGGKLAEALSAAAGGLEALATNSQTYYDAFFSAEEKTADTIDAITRAFESADVELAASREAYRAMVEDIDLTTEAGREMFATLMQLSGQAAQYYDILEQQGAALIGAAGSAYAALQRSIANQQQEIQLAASGTAAAINALTGVSNSLDAALKRLRGSSDDTVRMLRAQAVMTLNSALVTARAGGSLADYAGLQDALDVASNMDTSLYRSLEDFEREQGRTANLIAELEKVNGKQLTAEQKLLEKYDAQLSALDRQLSFAQAQLDALNGIDNSVMGVAAAVAAMNASVVAALQGLPKGAAQANTPQNNRSIIDTIYQSVLGRGTEGDEAGAAFWANALQSGKATYQDIAASIAKGAMGNSAESAATKKSAEEYLKGLGIPGFASGGLFGGGLRIVGEKGPELEVTGPSRIYNASQTAAMLGGGDSVRALASLQQSVERQGDALRSIAKHTMQTAKRVEFLERWDYDGLPTERDVA